MTTRRAIVITGGESGIGAACAEAFGTALNNVAILYHSDIDAAHANVVSILKRGGHAVAIQCKVDDETSVEAAFQRVEDAFGAADVLVNSAGINMSGLKVRDMPVETWQRLINTDLTGAFLMSRRFLKSRGENRGPAVIIHISSIHAEVVRAGGADYCSAKAGLNNLVRTLAVEEAANGVRVNAIEPGMILTPMNEKALMDDAYRSSLERNIPMKRAGRPEEVAALAVWLASDVATYITGATIVIDGGLSLLLGVGA